MLCGPAGAQAGSGATARVPLSSARADAGTSPSASVTALAIAPTVEPAPTRLSILFDIKKISPNKAPLFERHDAAALSGKHLHDSHGAVVRDAHIDPVLSFSIRCQARCPDRR
jgi:hypothetical protein